MKYRIVRKKIKRTQIYQLIKSSTEWLNISFIYKSLQDETSMSICLDMSRYDWNVAMKKRKRYGFKYKHLNRFYNELL